MAGAALLYLLLLTVIANLERTRNGASRFTPALSSLLPVAVIVMALSGLPGGGSLTAAGNAWPRLANLGFGLALALVMFALIWAKGPWQGVERILRLCARYERITFDARNSIHRLAALVLIFAWAALGWGAVSGNVDATPPFADAAGAAPQLLIGSLLYLALAVLGVGWLTRRDWATANQRLGLRRPRRSDCSAGIATAITLHVFVALTLAFWQTVAEPAVFESQLSGARLLFDALSSSLLLGGLLAVGVGISEEILFRGALQPVFGTLISSLLFVALHAQVAFSPAAALLFVVSLAFGLLRARVSTTAAIIAHAAYNALPFVLAGIATWL